MLHGLLICRLFGTTMVGIHMFVCTIPQAFPMGHNVARGPKPCKSTFSGDANNEMRSKKLNQ